MHGSDLSTLLATLDLATSPELARDQETLVVRIIQGLSRRQLTIGVAESCTGGLISKRLTDPPGASAAFSGGIVAYANEVKVGLLGVSEETIERFGAVSAECAQEMARGARSVLEVDIALSITGIAGPGGGSTEKPVGTVWIAIELGSRLGGGSGARRLDLVGDREAIRDRATEIGLLILWHLVNETDSPQI